MRFIPGRRSFLKSIPASLLAAMGLGRATAATSAMGAIEAVASPLKPVESLAPIEPAGVLLTYLLRWTDSLGVTHERRGDAVETLRGCATIPGEAFVEMEPGTSGSVWLERIMPPCPAPSS